MQVLSHTVSAALRTFISLDMLSKGASNTATFIENIDNLFDIFNSLTIQHSKKYKEAFKADDFQIKFLLYGI